MHHLVGLGLLAVWIGSLQIILDKGQEVDWFSSDWILNLTILAAVLLAAFIVWELMVKNPVMFVTMIGAALTTANPLSPRLLGIWNA